MLAARDSPIDLSVSVVAVTAPRAGGFADALRGQQRALDLHEMHVGRVRNARIAHRGAHAIGHLVDLRQAAEMLGRQCRRVGAADGERRRSPASPAARSNTIQCGAMPPSVPPDITKQIAGRVGLGEVALEQQFQRQRREAAAEVVDEAVALGLAEDGDHALRIDPAVGNRGFDAETSSGAPAEMRWTLAIGMVLSGERR